MMEESSASDDATNPPTDRMVEEDNSPEDAPPPRLMITKMILENFKSYAGVKEVGPFHKCFSAVVGPNGSGKSNVIDAMLFVFGKRAKKLRLNKVSELIHNSDSVKDNPPEFARVSVHFQEIIDTGDGDNDYVVVPNTEAVVTRVALKNNSSTYKLNGKNSSFKEIAAFLNSKGIDLDNNRFLILQGEVEMISMMAPKGKTENDEGLLEYLEDIIGSSKFVEQTNEAAQKVEALTELRQEKLNRVKGVEKEKDNLEGAKLEAEALLGKEREIRKKHNILYQIHAMRAVEEATICAEKKDAVVQKLEQERQTLVSASSRIEELEKGLSGLRKEYDSAFSELKKTKDEFSAYERRDIKIREEIKHGRSQQTKLHGKIKVESKKEKAAESKKEEATESIPVLEKKNRDISELKATEEAELDVLYEEVKGVTQELRKELEAKTQELAPVKQERAVFQAALDTAETEIKLLEDSTSRAKQRLVASEEELAALDETQNSKRLEVTKHQEELAQANARIVTAETEENALAQREGALAQRSKELMARAEDAKSALLSTGGEGHSKAVNEILKAARNGGELSKVGVLGRFGDLATIPEKYDVAVSTACGMLDHVVVQTTAGAQRCLEFLRRHNLGRASFIPLDKMKKGAHDRAVETPEAAPRLFELITPSNFAITPAIFLAVGNTLVAPDLDTATRWAYDYPKRWRVVTLDGKLIETAGTMAGGGRSVRRGGMRLANARATAIPVSADEDVSAVVERLEKESQQAHELLLECRKRRRELSDEIRALKKTVKALEVQLPKLTLQISGCDTTRDELTRLIPELRSQCELSDDDVAKRTELEKKVRKCKTDMVSCARLAAILEKDVEELQKAIMDAGGTPLKKQKAVCEKALSDLNDNEKALTSARVTAHASEKSASKAKESVERLQKELEQCQQDLCEKEKEFESLEDGAAAVMEAYEQVKVVEQEKRKALDSASKEVEELKKSQSEVKCAEIDLLGQVDAYEKQLSESRKKEKHWKKEIRKLLVAEEECDFEDEDEPEHDSEKSMSPAEGDDEAMEDAQESADTPFGIAGDVEVLSSTLPSFTFGALQKYSLEEIKDTILVLQTERDTLAKNANMGAIAEYRKKEADYLSRVAELDEVTEERNTARKSHEDLRRQRLEMFMDGFGSITLKLKEMYQMITLGGDAELELVDSLDPFSEGIVFSVRPPKKSWKNIGNLSGGEKTLSSLALVFALHHYKPTPLYVMDEIDAALDFKNVSIVANYIKERTKNAQFIIISLRNNMFELADRLVGIYKTHNCTKSVTINPRAFGVVGQQNGILPLLAAPLRDRSNNGSQPVGKEVSMRVNNSSSIAM